MAPALSKFTVQPKNRHNFRYSKEGLRGPLNGEREYSWPTVEVTFGKDVSKPKRMQIIWQLVKPYSQSPTYLVSTNALQPVENKDNKRKRTRAEIAINLKPIIEEIDTDVTKSEYKFQLINYCIVKTKKDDIPKLLDQMKNFLTDNMVMLPTKELATEEYSKVETVYLAFTALNMDTIPYQKISKTLFSNGILNTNAKLQLNKCCNTWIAIDGNMHIDLLLSDTLRDYQIRIRELHGNWESALIEPIKESKLKSRHGVLTYEAPKYDGTSTKDYVNCELELYDGNVKADSKTIKYVRLPLKNKDNTVIDMESNSDDKEGSEPIEIPISPADSQSDHSDAECTAVKRKKLTKKIKQTADIALQPMSLIEDPISSGLSIPVGVPEANTDEEEPNGESGHESDGSEPYPAENIYNPESNNSSLLPLDFKDIIRELHNGLKLIGKHLRRKTDSITTTKMIWMNDVMKISNVYTHWIGKKCTTIFHEAITLGQYLQFKEAFNCDQISKEYIKYLTQLERHTFLHHAVREECIDLLNMLDTHLPIGELALALQTYNAEGFPPFNLAIQECRKNSFLWLMKLCEKKNFDISGFKTRTLGYTPFHLAVKSKECDFFTKHILERYPHAEHWTSLNDMTAYDEYIPRSPQSPSGYDSCPMDGLLRYEQHYPPQPSWMAPQRFSLQMSLQRQPAFGGFQRQYARSHMYPEVIMQNYYIF
ncbi:uncharacterized protein LOC115624043 [Scaptodrosophila lebanonensis]|uniref:Uncharacterized protein LOC115624043 n=1 Tax=Drosophila lebanonensis TaxID=7225 RepID=A0A6J2TGB4_DROLE|nr:uncharacterized protein LOC115624043 [Scaptodrosophila lebanonensis]